VKDVPYLGWLFKSDTKAESMEDVLIFITPKILQPFNISSAPGPGSADPATPPKNVAAP